jgi:hypothetical protein
VCAEGNHGETVSSVAQAVEPGPEHGPAVAAAAQSDCGKDAADDTEAPDDSTAPEETGVDAQGGRPDHAGSGRPADAGKPADSPSDTRPGAPGADGND